ncbi:MAG: zinc-binding alcohol dehydrogenase family protein [Cyanobacteriota bacterium]|nr:zinc-binding alcohol dehydrogenase family protein [Cyanobacteriota bacterium]
MRAVGLRRHLPISDPEALLDLELPAPVLRPHDLLVRVEAIGVNPVDTKLRAGKSPADKRLHEPPLVLGFDCCGVVEALGHEAQASGTWQVGDRVMAAGDVTRHGCNAELVALDQRLCGRAPTSLGCAEAAALPLTGLTAWEGLFERLGLSAEPNPAQRGQTLLIIGGAGGVGSMAIQLAKRAGLRVIATASRPESQAWCLELGADAVIDHSQPLAPQLTARQDSHETTPQIPWIANFADTDAYWQQMAQLVAPQGAILAIVGNRGPLEQTLLKAKSARLCWEFMFTRAQYATPDLAQQGGILSRIAELIDAGELRSTARTNLGAINAANLRAAHALLEAGQTTGKIVLQGWS